MTTAPKQPVYDNSALMAEDEGYHKGLDPQLQMIAMRRGLPGARPPTCADRACS